MEPRPIRDILAECMRIERLGLMRPLWAEWVSSDTSGACEDQRRRSDHLMRLLRAYGVDLVITGEPPPSPQNGPSIYRGPTLIGVDRAIEPDATGFAIVAYDKDGKREIEQAFLIGEAWTAAERILVGDQEIMKRPGLARMLAAVIEIYRQFAQSLGGKPDA